jgi:DHA3 family macrolide efflux protein-like MFS transporter
MKSEWTAGWRPGLAAFWTIWSGQALSLVGSQAAQFALIWWLTLHTGSPTVLSTATLLALLPSILFGPLIGALVDRWSRARTMVIADGAVALGSLVLMVLFLSGRATTSAVLAFILWRAIGGAFHAPAMLAATSLLVPVERLARVQGLNQMLQGGLGIFTAPLGAVLLGLVGMAGAMAVDVLTALCAIVPLLFVPVPEPVKEVTGIAPGRAPVRRDIAAGFRYLRSLPGPMALIGFASVVNLFLVPAFALLPLLVLQELRGDASHQAWLGSAFSVGVLAGGLALGTLASSRSRVRTALGSLVGLGLATIALGVSPAGFFSAAVTAILAVGALSAMVNGSLAVLLQATIAPEYQGRVFTLLMSVAGAMTPIGLLLATPLADLAGVRAWYIAGGFVCAAMGTAAFFVRPIVRIEDGAGAGIACASSDSGTSPRGSSSRVPSTVRALSPLASGFARGRARSSPRSGEKER